MVAILLLAEGAGGEVGDVELLAVINGNATGIHLKKINVLSQMDR